ncbi:MAG: alpha,6-mannosyltransferase [Frankiales bacterium]|nr:alpha,6-mannosyltransferase [Frankiales bacterium]
MTLNTTGWLLPTGVLRRSQVIGFVSTSALAVAGIGAGAVPKTGAKDVIASELHLMALRENVGLRTVCTLVSYFALFGLLVSWALVGRRLREVTPGQVLVLCATWALPLLVAPPLFSADIYAYAGQGHLVANHIDAYVYGPGDYEPTSKWSFNVDPVWRFSPAPYGPFWLWLTGLAVGLPGNHLVVSIYLIRGLAVLGLALLAWSLTRLATSVGVPVQRALWITALNPLLLLHGVAGAHNDLLMLGLLAAGLMVTRTRPDLLGLVMGVALVTLAALIKAPALVALPFVPLLSTMARPRWRMLVVTGVVAAVVSVAVTVATGLGWGWVRVLADQGSRPSIWSMPWGLRRGLSSLAGQVFGAGAGSAVDTAVEYGVSALLGILLVTLWGRALLRRTQPLTAAGGALLLLFCLSFSEQPWYLAWALTPLSVTTDRRRIAFLAGFSGALCIYLAPGGRSWIRPPWFGVPILIAALIGVAVARWLTPPERVPQLAASTGGYAEVAVR